MELLLDAVAEAASGLAVQQQPPQRSLFVCILYKTKSKMHGQSFNLSMCVI